MKPYSLLCISRFKILSRYNRNEYCFISDLLQNLSPELISPNSLLTRLKTCLHINPISEKHRN